MSVPNTTSFVPYTGTGTVDTFVFTWQIFDYTDLTVISWVPATGAVSTLVYPTDYTISGLLAPTGGYVTLVAGNLATGTSLFIGNDPEEIQEVLLQQGAAFNPVDVMNALDKLTREVQAVRRIADNSIQISQVESGDGYSTTLPTAELRGTGQAILSDGAGNFTMGSVGTATVSTVMQPVVAASTLAIARNALGVTLNSRINVKDYPYLATGNGSTDDTTAIRAALAAAIAASADLYFPAGTYLMNGNAAYDEVAFGLLYIHDTGISLIGDGSGITTIKSGSATAGGVRFSGVTQSTCSGITINMNGGSGFGLYFGGQYSYVNDVFIKNIVYVRANDTLVSGIALVIPGSTLCKFTHVVIDTCANGIYAGFSGTDPSAPCQYLTFNDCSAAFASDGFNVRVKYGNNIAFNDLYVESAPERIIDLQNCVTTSFIGTSGEWTVEAALTTNSHIKITNCYDTKFDGVRITYAAGNVANKNIFEMSTANTLTVFNDILLRFYENMGELIKTTATQENVALTNVYCYALAGGKTLTAITTGAFGAITASNILGANFKPTGSHVHVVSAFCDVYVTPGTNIIHVEVGTGNKIYITNVEYVGAKIFNYVGSSQLTLAQGGNTEMEIAVANSYYKFGNGITFKWSSAVTPTSNVTATPGSICVTNNGTNGVAWLKESGTGNTGWLRLSAYLEGSATYDPPSLVDGAGATTTVTVTGAALGDYAQASFSLDLQGITLSAYVSSANTVSVRFQNESGGTIDLASGTLLAKAEKAQ